jgi:hypothetical protein
VTADDVARAYRILLGRALEALADGALSGIIKSAGATWARASLTTPNGGSEEIAVVVLFGKHAVDHALDHLPKMPPHPDDPEGRVTFIERPVHDEDDAPPTTRN